MTNFHDLALSLLDRFPSFSVKIKEESRLMRAIDFFIKPFAPTFMSRFTTTIGYTVYMPKDLIGTPEGYKVLRHEVVHMEDRKKHGLWFPFSYLFVLPIFWTKRAEWEFKAYVETMKVEYETTGYVRQHTIDWIASLFTSSAYFWMMPPWKKEEIHQKLEAEALKIMGRV